MRWNYVGSVDYEKKRKRKKDLDPVGVLQHMASVASNAALAAFFWSHANVTDVQGANVGGADSRTRCLIIELMRPRNNFAD